MGRARNAAERARDRRRASDLYLQGWLQVDIAKELSIDQATVSRDLKAIQKEWLKSALIDFNEAKARELAKVDKLERTYWAAWERSCEDAETTTRKTKGKVTKVQIEVGREEEGKVVLERPAEATRTLKGQAGDPRFLQGVERCIERRCKILGIDAPVKMDHGQPIVINVTGNVDPDKL